MCVCALTYLTYLKKAHEVSEWHHSPQGPMGLHNVHMVLWKQSIGHRFLKFSQQKEEEKKRDIFIIWYNRVFLTLILSDVSFSVCQRHRKPQLYIKYIKLVRRFVPRFILSYWKIRSFFFFKYSSNLCSSSVLVRNHLNHKSHSNQNRTTHLL